MKKRRRMTKKQLKYFGKRKRTSKVVKVARRRSYRGRARSYARKGIGGMKGMLAPIVGGVADNVLDSYIPQAPGLGGIAVGMFLHNNTVKEIGLYKLGYGLANYLPIPGNNGGGSGGWI